MKYSLYRLHLHSTLKLKSDNLFVDYICLLGRGWAMANSFQMTSHKYKKKMSDVNESIPYLLIDCRLVEWSYRHYKMGYPL